MVAEAGLEPTTSGLRATLSLISCCCARTFYGFYPHLPTNPEVISPIHPGLSTRCYRGMGQRMGQDILLPLDRIGQYHPAAANNIKLTNKGASPICWKTSEDSPDSLRRHWVRDRIGRNTSSPPWLYQNPDWSRNSAPG